MNRSIFARAKRPRLLCAVLLCALLLAACAPTQDPAAPTLAVSPSPTPGQNAQASGGEGEAAPEPEAPGEEESAAGKNKRLYDPSIYVIEASGTWRQELAEGYFVDYQCELYLDKVDANDNRSSEGTYSGFLWLNAEVDAGAFIEEMLGGVPVEMDFAAGAEGICDNLAFYFAERDVWERGQYAIPLENGGEDVPGEDMLVDRGSCIVVAMSAYLDAVAEGLGGAYLEHHDQGAEDVELNFVVHMQPDSLENGTERSVRIYLSDAQGMSVTLTGTMRRLPGYPEDVLRYAQDAPYQEALNRHLK